MPSPAVVSIQLPSRLRVAARALVWRILRLRNRVRANDLWVLLVAVGVGVAAGLVAHWLGALAGVVHGLLYKVPAGDRLSAQTELTPLWRLLWLPAGGLALGLMTWLRRRNRPQSVVDPVEANALRGGRMSLRDSGFLAAQTLISNGCGASVGLEAAYTQLGSGIASAVGMALNFRRNDLRVVVGAGAGAAIAATFGAPLTGAFYAFELIIGSYTVANIAPVVGAALAGYLAAQAYGGVPHLIEPLAVELKPEGYVFCVGLGVVAALMSVAIMRAVSEMDRRVRALKIPRPITPMIGGAIAAVLVGLWSPEIMASGHGALQQRLIEPFDPTGAALGFGLKALASIVCLGFGFRGGLFFASLLLGALLGQLYWLGVTFLGVEQAPDILVSALVGMAALAAGIVGGPLTVSFLVLETTGDFNLAGATLASALMCSLIVRESFGYSFSTWRLHLRGETIRGAHDVGRIRALTVGKMMRKAPAAVEKGITVAEFMRRFPLGSSSRVLLLDEAQRYAGIILTANVYTGQRDGGAPIDDLARQRKVTLRPEMSAREAIAAFDSAGSDELAVVDSAGAVLGLLTESYAARRLAEELEKTRQELTGEV